MSDADQASGATDEAVVSPADTTPVHPEPDPITEPVTLDVPAEPEDDDAEPDLTAEEWQHEATKARKQAARYRTQLRDAQQRLAALEAAPPAESQPDPVADANARAAAAERRASVLEAAVSRDIPAAALSAFRAVDAADADGLGAALDALAPFLAPRAAGVQLPPSSTTTPPTLDQQIADAERSGDVKRSIALKSQKASGR